MKKIFVAVSLMFVMNMTILLTPAKAETSVQTTTCHAHKVVNRSYWTCVTPGSYCSSAAHQHYGYAKATHRRYKCLRYTNGQWRWKRA